jgi:hypothetical protein
MGMNNSWYQPSTFGMRNLGYTSSNYGNPGATPYGPATFNAATAGSSIPLGSAVGLPGTPLGGGFGPFNPGLPAAINPVLSPSGMQAPGNLPTPFNSAFGPNNPEETPPAVTPEGIPVPPTGVGTGPGTGAAAPGIVPVYPGAALATAAPTVSPLLAATSTTSPQTISPFATATLVVPSASSIFSPYSALRPTTFGSAYSAPQYQSTFYSPLRRVYGYQGY